MGKKPNENTNTEIELDYSHRELWHIFFLKVQKKVCAKTLQTSPVPINLLNNGE